MNSWNDSLQQNYYQKPALMPTMPWLVQYKVEAPLVNKQSSNSYQIQVKSISSIKQYAVLESTNNQFSVAAILMPDSKMINLNALGIQKKTNTQYWLVAIGKQNQLSSLVALN
jgi:hypothetical protein